MDKNEVNLISDPLITIGNLLVEKNKENYAKAKQIYKALSKNERREAIVWFYLYNRDYYGIRRTKKYLKLAKKSGSTIVYGEYAKLNFVISKDTALRYYRKHYAHIIFKQEAHLLITTTSYLTFIWPFKVAFIKNWGGFIENQKNPDRTKYFAEVKLKNLISLIHK